MTPDEFTIDLELFKDLLFCDDPDAMRQLKERLLNYVLNAEVEEQIGTCLHERSEKRITYRNGYRNRDLNSRDGTLHLRVPKLRNGTFSTQLFARYQRSERALMLAMMEMVIQGVSTRKVAKITEELCGTQFSAQRHWRSEASFEG